MLLRATTSTTRPTAIRVVPIMVSLILALFPVQLDAMVTAPAMPLIAGSFGSLEQMAWISTAYLLTMAIGMILSGRIGDMFGRRPVLVTALAVFLGGSLWAAMSTDMTTLILARGVQGLGAGMTFTTLLSTVADIAPPEKRARYQGVFGAVAPVSMIAGPWVGGLVTEHLGWRWIFWLNTPIVALALLGVVLLLRVPARNTGGRVDLPGLVALVVASTGLTLAASWGGQYGWTSTHVLAAAAVGVAGIIGVWYAERRAVQPFLPLGLFANRPVLSSFAIMVLGPGAVMMTAVGYLPVFLEIVQGKSASNSGLLLLPMLLPAMLVAVTVGRWTNRPGRFRVALVIGTAVLTAGCVLLATMGAGTSGWQAACWMVVTGAGVGFLFQTPLVLVQNAAPAAEVGAATGSASYMRMIGGAVGVGALGSVFVNRFAASLSGAAAPGVSGLDVSSLGPDRVAALPPAAQHVVLDAAASANSVLFWVAAALAALAFVAALLVRSYTDDREAAQAEAHDTDQAPTAVSAS